MRRRLRSLHPWYQRLGGFDTRYRIAAEDLRILQLFSQPGFKAVYLPEVLVTLRLGGASNRSLRNVARKTAEDWRTLGDGMMARTSAGREAR